MSKGKVNVGDKKGEISVREAGRRGGNATKAGHGHEFYESIGRKGGAKVKELIEKGKELIEKGKKAEGE
jgi:general stress protein YciG